MGYGPFVVPELAEAASRTGDTVLVRAALEWLSERTRVTPTTDHSHCPQADASTGPRE
jgi:hypothetical protein